MKALLTRAGAAELLDVSPSSFDKLRELASFPEPTWIDSHPRWIAEQLVAWANALPTSKENPRTEPTTATPSPVRHRRSKHDRGLGLAS